MPIDRHAVQEALESAAEAAARVEDRFAAIAFQQVLRAELELVASGNPRAAERVATQERNHSGQGTDLPEPHVVARSRRAEQIVWAVCRLTAEGVPATTETIGERIRTELSIQPPHPSNISKALGELTPQYLLREENPNGPGFVYQPSRHASDIFRRDD